MRRSSPLSKMLRPHGGNRRFPAGCAIWKWWDCGFLRYSQASVRSEYARPLRQPEGRQRVANGVTRGNEACAEKPPQGAEDGAVAISPRAGASCFSRLPHGSRRGLFSCALTSLDSESSWISTFPSHTLFGENATTQIGRASCRETV